MYWLKQVGENSNTFYQDLTFGNRSIRVEFGKTRKPSGIHMNDTLIVYGIGIKLILFAGNVRSQPYPPSHREITDQTWRRRWYWSLDVDNLSQEFGRHWHRFALNPFDLVREYRHSFPGRPITNGGNTTLGALSWRPYLRLADGFGRYILQRVLHNNH